MITFPEQERQDLEPCSRAPGNKKVPLVLLRAKGVKRKDLVDLFCVHYHPGTP